MHAFYLSKHCLTFEKKIQAKKFEFQRAFIGDFYNSSLNFTCRKVIFELFFKICRSIILFMFRFFKIRKKMPDGKKVFGFNIQPISTFLHRFSSGVHCGTTVNGSILSTESDSADANISSLKEISNMAAINNVVSLQKEFKAEWSKPQRNIKKCEKLLDQLKVFLFKNYCASH